MKFTMARVQSMSSGIAGDENEIGNQGQEWAAYQADAYKSKDLYVCIRVKSSSLAAGAS